MKSHLYFILIVLVTLLVCCKKDDDEVDPSEGPLEPKAWSTQGKGSAAGNRIAVDSEGSIIVTGSLYHSGTPINFGGLVLEVPRSQIVPTPLGMYMVKYTSEGVAQWVKLLTNADARSFGANSISVDKSGNIFLGGNFGEAQYFQHLSITGKGNVFLLKYSASGNLLWAKANEEPGYGPEIYASGVDIDQQGNAFVVGGFSGKAILNGQTFITRLITSEGRYRQDIFVAKLNPSGDYEWVRTGGGEEGDYGSDVAVDQQGSAYISGGTRGGVDLGFGDVKISKNDLRGLIVKYSGDGVVRWVKQFDSEVSQIEVDGKGNPFIITPVGYSRNSVKKLNGNGEIQWEKAPPADAEDLLEATNLRVIKVNAKGEVFAAGDYYFSLQWDGKMLRSNGSLDIFIAKIGSDGTMLWLKSDGGINQDVLGGIAFNRRGNLFITGSYRENTTLADTVLSNENDRYSMFVARYKD